MKLVICCRVKMPDCKFCAHSTPHLHDWQGSYFCTEWQDCYRHDDFVEDIRVRCTKLDTADDSTVE